MRDVPPFSVVLLLLAVMYFAAYQLLGFVS